MNRIRDDYDNSREVPTSAPDWLEAVNAIATIKQTDPAAATNGRILEQIHHSADVQHKENLAAYRKSTANRHRILKAMTPYWRKLAYSVDEVGNRLKEITTRAQSIDQQMLKFNEIVAGTHQAERALKASSITQFVIAALVIAVAAGGAFFNFHLIALPMSEMVGSAQRIGGVKVADLAALVIICLETTAGIFLLESLRITQLFPLIGSMDDRVRRAIMICASCLLLILASTESALAFMRDQIALDLANLRASLAGVDSAEGHSGINSWIPLAANMVLGFILPLALTMVAIPLEYLLQTARTLLGSLAEILLAASVSILRLTASGIKHTGVVVIGLYDLLIAAPLWVENLIRQKQRKAENQYAAQTEEF
ncbi:putative membrane protein [Teredinibacter turnerae T7901]|uniref:Membrane protein n=1 Tax=Teredinibacter turnerae (strain ATCC 39867 / T7901) TaxID=377629 RepID=C5BN97_TERTT|nr:putative membrane protein [Teredinibacter turnerae T7901]